MDLYENSGYAGLKHRYTGDGNVKRNVMSSLKLRSGCCVQVFSDYKYGGESKTVCKNTNWIGRAWNDKVSSVKIFVGKYF